MLSSKSLIIASSLALVQQAYAQTARTITFKNQCSKDVWTVPTSGSAGSCSTGCPAGSSCNNNNGLCFWNNPTPSGGNWRIKAGQSSTITFPKTTLNTAWSGNYGFCMDGQQCTTTPANCDANGCGAPGIGNLAEFTLANNNFVDFYDISNIGGINVPLSITPQTVDSTNSGANTPYNCGAPGAPTGNVPTLGSANWAFTPPTTEYQWVNPPTTSPTSCTTPSQCPGGQTCGLYHNTQTQAFSQVCGYLAGYWTAGAVCGIDHSTSIFGCNTQVTNGPYSGTHSDMQGCGVTSGSCYQGGADQYCCGCANWWTILGTGAVPPTTQACGNNDTNWDNIILPTLTWLKRGCPNCYTFPYDDPSSTFVCSKYQTNSAGTWNTQNYTVTLCPNGVAWPGLPGGSGSTGPGTTTSTAGGSGPTGTPGKCAGTSYSASQVCDNGHICPSGQYYCNGSCYNPATSCCSAGKLSSATGSCQCSAGQFFDGTAYVCDNNVLCPKGTYDCGGGCYNPANYGCCNGALTAAGQGC